MEAEIWIPLSLALVAVVGLILITRPYQNPYHDDRDFDPAPRIVIYPGRHRPHPDKDDWDRYPRRHSIIPYLFILFIGIIIWLAIRNGWL